MSGGTCHGDVASGHAGTRHRRPAATRMASRTVAAGVPRNPMDVGTTNHDVTMYVVGENVCAGTEHVGCRRVVPKRHRDPVDPHVRRWRRSPAHVCVTPGRHAPDDPGVRVAAPRNPGPTRPTHPDPAAVVKDDPSERVVAHPYPVATLGQRPVSRGDIGRESLADDVTMRHPDQPIGRVLHPGPIRSELRLEIGERARVRVRILGCLHRPSLRRCFRSSRLPRFGRALSVRSLGRLGGGRRILGARHGGIER
jgi:hypothetical protein